MQPRPPWQLEVSSTELKGASHEETVVHAVHECPESTEVLGGDLAKWADEKTEPTHKLTLLSGSIASGESRTCLG
eukprot:scaffold56687_cov59-Phaeocystis_antarctica.AAC.1